MEYFNKSNKEILEELHLDKLKGWFPIDEVMDVNNVTNNKMIKETMEYSTFYSLSEYYPDSLVIIYPNHISRNYKNKDTYSSKIKLLYPGTFEKDDEFLQKIESKNLYIDLPICSIEEGNKAYPLFRQLLFNLKLEITTTGILNSRGEINLDNENLEDFFFNVKTYEDDIHLTDEKKIEFLNKAYRIVGIHFTTFKSAYKQPLSKEELEYINAGYKKHKNDSKTVKEYNEEITLNDTELAVSENTKKQIEKMKNKINKLVNEYHLDQFTKGLIQEFINNWSDSERENINTKPLFLSADLYLSNHNENNRKNRIIFFKMSDCVNDFEKTTVKWRRNFITEIAVFFKKIGIPIILIPENYLLITDLKYIFSNNEDIIDIIDYIYNKENKFNCFIADTDGEYYIKKEALLETFNKIKVNIEETYLDLKNGLSKNYELIDDKILDILMCELSIFFEYCNYHIYGINKENGLIYVKKRKENK